MKIATIVSLIFGFLAGIIFTGITISISSGEMMVKEFKSPYDFNKTIQIMQERINGKEGWHVHSHRKPAVRASGFVDAVSGWPDSDRQAPSVRARRGVLNALRRVGGRCPLPRFLSSHS